MAKNDLPVPSNEKQRLKALLNYNVLDTLLETEFDDITKLVSFICQVPIALISLIDDKRQWFKSNKGLDVNETARDISFCQYAIMNTEVFEIPDALQNETFKNNPLVTAGPHIRFYAGAPLTTPDGLNIGTLCVIDTVPKKLSEDQKMSLSILSKHVITQLELRSKNSDLIKEKNIAELAVFTKDSFLANMSHEIRTPMNAILGFTDLLSQSNLNKIQSEYVNNVQTAGDNLLLIINDILDLSKMESGKLVIESSVFDLKKTLKHVYDLLKLKASKNNLEFNLFLDAEMPEFVIGDKGRMNQIMMNLAGNAIKFTQQGEVTISVKKTAETDKNYMLWFSVKDTGIGISEDKLAVIFDRFTQAEQSTTRKFGGTGLGLNIAKQLVELQNGKIQVKSKLGSGSEFYFSLDFEKSDSSFVESVVETTVEKKSFGKISILLCEDNDLNQRLARTVIENFGFDLDIAFNGQEGIDLLLKNKYDLILMDLQMPIMDGYQTTIYIREKLKLNTPIIAMTAHFLAWEQQKCIDIGMNDYISKPFKQKELLRKVHLTLEVNTKKQNKFSISDDEKSLIKNSPIRSIDFSYLDELSGCNIDFKQEMIQIFIKKVPIDLDLLEKAIYDNDNKDIARIAHEMKSSLSMFQLEEVEYLDKIEKNAKKSIIVSNQTYEFTIFKCELMNIIEILKNINLN